jgi:predicted metal-dependent HD superfamily phosphohydrolase
VFESRHAPLVLATDTVAELVTRYGEPHRAYHHAGHIAEVLRWFDWVADEVGWDHPADVYQAIVFHDAIYDPLAKDNEARSAELARRHGASERAAALILLTARHGSLASADVDREAAHFLDCDTAILGAPAAEFDAYDAAIGREYAAIPAEAFRAGRRQFLATMLARPRIFLSDLFHARLDAAARANLARVLSRY